MPNLRTLLLFVTTALISACGQVSPKPKTSFAALPARLLVMKGEIQLSDKYDGIFNSSETETTKVTIEKKLTTDQWFLVYSFDNDVDAGSEGPVHGDVDIKVRLKSNSDIELKIYCAFTDDDGTLYADTRFATVKKDSSLRVVCPLVSLQLKTAFDFTNKAVPVCPASLSKGYEISRLDSPVRTRTYFSSTANLTSSTSTSCTYTGQITTEYSTPNGSGVSVGQGSTTIRLSKLVDQN